VVRAAEHLPDRRVRYSKPGAAQQPTIAWMTYQTAGGKVIYGGRSMGRVPGSRRCVIGRKSGHHRVCAIHAKR